GGLDALVEVLGGLPVNVSRTGARREARGLADVLGEARRYPAEITGQEPREPMALGTLEHLQQHPELDPVGMRLDLARRRGELLVRAAKLLRLPFRSDVGHLDVRVGDDRLLDVFVDRGPP